MSPTSSQCDPHGNQPVLRAGPELGESDAAIILLHGRGSTALGILSLHAQLEANKFAALAPQAAGNSWYPHSFLARLDDNQPNLDSALRRVESLVAEVVSQGMLANQLGVVGFSQGACLATEYVARHPRRYGAVVAFTGGLIGPPGTPPDYPGSLEGTPIFLGTSDPDPHVPFERVQETKAVLARMGARVELRRYAGMAHTINQDEIDAARELLQRMVSDSRQDHP